MSLELHLLKGFVGKDPELKYNENGTGIASFSLAISHSRKKDGEWVKTTTWYNCTAFGQLAEQVSERIKKGQLVSVIGNKLEINQYVSQQDGSHKVSLNLTLREIDFAYEPEEGEANTEPDEYQEEEPKTKASGKDKKKVPF